MIPTVSFERSLREDKISFEKFAVAHIDVSSAKRLEALAPDFQEPILIMTMDRSCRRIWSMTKHLRVLHDPEFFARGERLLALSYFQKQGVFASFVAMKRKEQLPIIPTRDASDGVVSPYDAETMASSALAADESTTRVTFWNHKLECLDEIMIGDRPYRSFAHDPRGEEVLLAGESGFAAYRLKAEPRWGDKGFSCALSKVQSVQLNMGTSGDHVVSVKYLSPDIFALVTTTTLRIFIKALPHGSVSAKKSWLRTNVKPPVYVPLKYTECALPDGSTGYGRSGAHILDIEVTTASNLAIIVIGYSDGFVSVFSSAWMFRALQLAADAGRRGLHPDDVARAPSLNRVLSFRAFRDAAPLPFPTGAPVSAIVSMSLKIFSGSPIGSANIAFSIIAMDGTGVLCHYGIPRSIFKDIDSLPPSKINIIPPLIGFHNMGFDKSREIYQRDQTLRRVYPRWEPTSTQGDLNLGHPLLAVVSLSHGRASIVASVGGQMCFLNINELQAEVTRCLPAMESQVPLCYSLASDSLHHFDSALAFESSIISDDDEKLSIEDDRIVMITERNTSMVHWVNSVSDRVLRTTNLGDLLVRMKHRQPASFGKITSLNDFGTVSFSLFSTTASALIVGFSTGSICVLPMAMLGKGTSASGSEYIRLNTKAVHTSTIRKMIICPLLDGSGDFLITGDDRGVIASWKINKSLDSSTLNHLWSEGPHIGWIVHLETFNVPLYPDPGKSAELERMVSANGAPKSREIVVLTACSGGVIKAWRLSYNSGKLSLLASLNVGSKPVISSVSALAFLMGQNGPDSCAVEAGQIPAEIKLSQDFRIVCICGRSSGTINSFIMSNSKLSSSSNCVPLSTIDLHRHSITAQAVMPPVFNTQAFKVGSGNTYLSSSKISLVVASEDSLSYIHIESDGRIHLDGCQAISLPHALSNRQIRSIFPQVVLEEIGNDSYINCIVVRDEIVTKHLVDADIFPPEWETLTSAYYETMLAGALTREARTATPSSAARSRLSSRQRPRTGASEGQIAMSGGMSISRPQSPNIIELRPSLERDEAPVVLAEVSLRKDDDDVPMPAELEGSLSTLISVSNTDSLVYFGAKTFFPSHSTRATAPIFGKAKSADIQRQLIANLFSIKKDQSLIEFYRKFCTQNSITDMKLIPSDLAIDIMHGYSKFSCEEILRLVHSLGIDDGKGISYIQICKVLATLRFVSEQAHSNYTFKQKKYKQMRSSKAVVTYNSMGERVVQRDSPLCLEPRISDGIVKGVHTQVKKLWDCKASKVFSLMESDFNERGFLSDVFPAIVDRIPLSFQGILKANHASFPSVWMPDASNYVELGRAIKIARSLFDRRLGLQRDLVLAMNPNDSSAFSDLVSGLPTMAELIVQYFERNYGSPELNVSHTKVAYFIEALFQYSRYPVMDSLRKFTCPDESGIVLQEGTLWFYVEARDFLYSRNCVQRSSDLVAVYLEGSLTVSESICVESSTSVGFQQWERVTRREAALCVVEMVQRRGAFGSIAVEKALKITEKLPSLNSTTPTDASLLSNSVGRFDLEYSNCSADEEWIDLESFLDVLTTFVNTLIIDIENANSRLFSSDNATKNLKFASNVGTISLVSVAEISKTLDDLKYLSCSLMYYDKTRLGVISSANFATVISREGDLVLGLIDTEHRNKFISECRRLFCEESSQGVVYIDILGVLLSAAMQGFGSGLVRGADAIKALSQCTRGLEDDLANILVFLLGHSPSPYRLHSPLWTLGSLAIQSIVDTDAAKTSFDWKKGTFSLNTDGSWFANTKPVSDEPGMLSINKIEPTSHSATGIGEVALGVDGTEWRHEAVKMDAELNQEPVFMISPRRSDVEKAHRANAHLVAALSQTLSDSPSSSALIALPVSEQYAMSTINSHIYFNDKCETPIGDAAVIKRPIEPIDVLDDSLEHVGVVVHPSVTKSNQNFMDPSQNATGNAESRLHHFSPKHSRSIFNYLEDDVHDRAFYTEEAMLRSMRIPVINRIIRSRGKDESSQLDSMTLSIASLGDSASAADGSQSTATSEYRKVLSEEEDAAVEMARERERMRLLLNMRAESARRNKAIAKQREKEIRKKMVVDRQKKAQKKMERAKIIDGMRSSSSNPDIPRGTINNKRSVSPKPRTPKPETSQTVLKVGRPEPVSISDAEAEREVLSLPASVRSNSTSIIPDGSNDIESVESSDTVGSDEISLPSVKEQNLQPHVSGKINESNTASISIQTPERVSDDVVILPASSPTSSANLSEPQASFSVAAFARTPKPSIESKLSEISKSTSPSTPKVDPRVQAINQRKIDAKKELDEIKQMKANDFNVLSLGDTSIPTKTFSNILKTHVATKLWVGADDAKESQPTTLLGRKINRFLNAMKNVQHGTNLHPRRYDEDVEGRRFFMPQMFADDIRFDPVSAPAYEAGWFREQLQEDREIRDRVRLEPSKDFSDLTRLINFKKECNRAKDELVVEESDLRPAEYTSVFRTNRVDWNAFMEREKAEASRNAETSTSATSASRRSTFTAEHAFSMNKKKSNLPNTSFLGQKVHLLPLGYVVSEKLRKDNYLYYQVDVPNTGTILTVNLKCHLGSASLLLLWREGSLPSATHFDEKADCTEMNNFEAQIASHAPENASSQNDEAKIELDSAFESSRHAIIAVLSHEESTDFTMWAISSSSSKSLSQPIANVTKLIKELNLLASRDLKDLAEHFPICRREVRKQVLQESVDEANNMTNTIKSIVAKSVQDSITFKSIENRMIADQIVRSAIDTDEETMERFVARAGTMAAARAMRATILAPGGAIQGEKESSCESKRDNMITSSEDAVKATSDYQRKKILDIDDDHNSDEHPLHVAKLERILSQSGKKSLSRRDASSSLTQFPLLQRHPTLKDLARTGAEGLDSLIRKPKPINKNLTFVPTPISYKLTQDGPLLRSFKK